MSLDLQDLCLRRHRFFFLDYESRNAVIWNQNADHKFLEIPNFVYRLRDFSFSSRFIFSRTLLGGGEEERLFLGFYVFDIETGEKVQTYKTETGEYRSGSVIFFVFKDKYLFFTSQSLIHRITLEREDRKDQAMLDGQDSAPGALGMRNQRDRKVIKEEEEFIKLNPEYVTEFGGVGDWIFTFQEEKIVIWDPETFETLRSIRIGQMKEGFVIPNTKLIGVNAYPFLVNGETLEKVQLPSDLLEENRVCFFPDGKILVETNYSAVRDYTMLDRDWKKVQDFKSRNFHLPYDSDSFLVFAKGTGNVIIQKFDGTRLYSDFVSDGSFLKGMKISDAVEIPLSHSEQDQETQRFSNFLLSVTPVAKDIARVIGKFI